MNKNMTRQPVVYGLRVGGSFGYVGMTMVNMRTRLWEHRSRARAGHSAPIYDWIRLVGVDAVEVVELDNDPNREVFWITKLLNEGHPIQNQVSRDGVSNSMSAASRKKIGAPKRGKPTWIKGKTGESAGWTQARREAQSARMKARMR